LVPSPRQLADPSYGGAADVERLGLDNELCLGTVPDQKRASVLGCMQPQAPEVLVAGRASRSIQRAVRRLVSSAWMNGIWPPTRAAIVAAKEKRRAEADRGRTENPDHVPLRSGDAAVPEGSSAFKPLSKRKGP